MADPTTEISLDLTPALYAAARAQAWVAKVNGTSGYTLANSQTRCVAQWGDGVDNAEKRMQARLSGVAINAREYGAVGDGTTDDTAALQDALDALSTTGGLLYLPPGEYRVTSTLTFDGEITIVGAGPVASIVAYEGEGYAFDYSTHGTRAFRVNIESLRVTYGVDADGGIALYDVSLATCRRVEVLGPGIGTNGNGFYVGGTINGNAVYNGFERCLALGCLVGFAIYNNGSNDNSLHESRATLCTTGVDVVDSNHVVIDDCQIEACGIGVAITSSSTSLADALEIKSCRFENNTTYNVQALGTTANVRWVDVHDNHHVTGTPYGPGLLATTYPTLNDPDVAAIKVSPITSGPVRSVEATVAGLTVARYRNSNTGSGSPNVLELSSGRAAGHALSVNQWNGSADTENAFITGGGAAQFTGVTVTGDVTMSGSAAVLSIGDAAVAGNAQVRRLKGDANNQTGDAWYNAGVFSWGIQHASTEDLNWINSSSTSIGGWQRTGNYFRSFAGFRLVSNSGPLWLSGSGTPEGAVTAPVGSLFTRTDGGANTTLYVKESGSGNTGWVAK